MSVLCIDGRDIAHIGVGIAEKSGDGWFLPDYMVHDARPEDFLRLISAIPTDYDAMLAIVGPGSATALRTSLAILNTIAFTRSIPLYGVEYDRADAPVLFSHFLSPTSPPSIPQGRRECILPVYANAPNITASKKDALQRTL